ncbi:MAG: mechanosensitive ion channel [Pyrobaculum sp.]|jgi:small-conductance mechanosensitive channel|nr:mechanosensitive ion channel [Pyrobaculum sp.]
MKRRLVAVTLSKLVLIGIVSAVLYYFAKLFLPLFGIVLDVEQLNLVKSLIIVVAGSIAINIVGNAIIMYLRDRVKEKAYAVGNVVKVIGILAVLLFAISISRLGAELALLGGTVTGLVLGLALQPVLGNLFAGIIILTTRFVEVGDTVRIVASQIPYHIASLPSYKYFSPDYVAPGYKGRVVEIGLIYTTLILDTGYELRVPNMVLLSSGVVDYTPKWSEKQVVLVRVELPLSVIDLDKLEEEIRKALEGLNVVAVDYTEQSDKDFVIVRVKLEIPPGENWRAVKSEALKRLLKYRDEKIGQNLPRYLCLTKGVECTRYLAQM